MDMDPAIPWTTQSVDDFCRRRTAPSSCYDDVDGGGPTQTVSEGVHFLLGHPQEPCPQARSGPTSEAPGSSFGSCLATVSGYFNAQPGSCDVELNVKLDAGSCLRGLNATCFPDAGPTRRRRRVRQPGLLRSARTSR